MSIVTVTPADRAGFLSLVNAEIRPDRAKTNAWDDFPVILGPQNSDWQLVYKAEDGTIAGCIACLIREHKTSCGLVPVAGIGSVVTRPEFRGQGISSALQNELMERLKGKNIPLGVLWTDKPEIYSGRGFVAAGWEFHASVLEMTTPGLLDSNFRVREFRPEDAPSVSSLFEEHPYRTVRFAGDSDAYYTMPGTRGFVLVSALEEIKAAVFCGKGGDFPEYIAEFSGDPILLPFLFQHVRDEKLAHQVLIPAGSEEMVNTLVDLGCGWLATTSGQWVVLDPAPLVEIVSSAGGEIPADLADPVSWLGCVDSAGHPLIGPLTTAVWGFDSV
jgi:predicted N-acetyltransferase YhbS